MHRPEGKGRRPGPNSIIKWPRNWSEPGWAMTIWLQMSIVWKLDVLEDIILALSESRSQGECNNFFASGVYKGPLSISQAHTSLGFYLPDSVHTFSLPAFPARWVRTSVSKAILDVTSSVKSFLTRTNSFLSSASNSWYLPLLEQCIPGQGCVLCIF